MENSAQIIVADDEQDLLQLLVQRLSRKGYNVEGFSSGEAALKALDSRSFDVGIFDIRMPGIDGIELLRETKKRIKDLEVIILTGHGTIETAIEAMKAGAYDYLTKPYNLSELEIIIKKAIEKKNLAEENTRLKEVLKIEGFRSNLIGESPSFKNMLDLTKRVANSHVPVLIEGESGTGKELIARAIHNWSERAEKPFIAINSGGLMENLLESELFGHVKGAFTGAMTDKKGLLEMADGGTIFFDEIGEMPLALQVKLLRFFESSEFRRVGDLRLRYADARVVAATNRNLADEIANGNFREDLFFRLNVVNILSPPLRERREDIPLLVDYFLSKKFKGKKKILNKEALEFLKTYHFPGNVRELAHIIERGVLLSSAEEIKLEEMFTNISPKIEQLADSRVAESITLQEVEKQHIEKTLQENLGNKVKTAKALGISLRSLYRKVEEYRITSN